MSYRDVIYLILILKRFYYDLLKFNFTLGLISLTLQIRKVVHFFLHTLYIYVVWYKIEKLFFSILSYIVQHLWSHGLTVSYYCQTACRECILSFVSRRECILSFVSRQWVHFVKCLTVQGLREFSIQVLSTYIKNLK